MAKKRDRAALLALLANWNTLNRALMGLGEDEVARLLLWERDGANRLTFALRLHSRLNRLRRERERRALAKEAA
jgi:hypothetical protein